MIFFSDNSGISWTRAEKAAIQYIHENASTFVSLNISQAAKNAAVSTSTFTNFVKKAGFSSFKALQIHIAQEIAKRARAGAVRTGSKRDLLDDISFSVREAVDSARVSMEKGTLLVACDLLAGAKFVYCFGVGWSNLASEGLEQGLLQLGTNAKRLSSPHDLVHWMDLSQRQKSLVVLFSNTLNTREIKSVVKMCEANQIFTILVTMNKVASDSNKQLVIRYDSFQAEEKGLSRIPSKYSQLFIVDALLVLLSEKLAGKRIPIDTTFLD